MLELRLSAGKPENGFSLMDVECSFSKDKAHETSISTSLRFKPGDETFMIGGSMTTETVTIGGAKKKVRRTMTFFCAS